MASIKGFSLKSVKHPIGKEGYGLIGTMYLNGKKIGTYEDWGDGTMGDTRYDKKEYEEDMMRTIIAYAKENHNEYIENLYRERPQQYEEKVARFKRCYPYIPDEDINIQTMSMDDIAYLISDLSDLMDLEKTYKKYLKQGYDVLTIKGNHMVAYNSARVSLDEIKKNDYDKIYGSVLDFEIV